MMNVSVTQCEGFSISVNQLKDKLDDHWTQTEGKKNLKIKWKKNLKKE